VGVGQLDYRIPLCNHGRLR